MGRLSDVSEDICSAWYTVYENINSLSIISRKGNDLLLTERMTTQVEQWTALNDRRVIFLACYQRMTDHMLAGVAGGEFHDPDWVAQLINDFADYYFAALQSWDQGASAPLVWQYTFACAANQNMSVVQHLLLGVNAHINCHLVLVLDDLLRPEWPELSPTQRDRRHHDYLTVNRVIQRTIDRVQDEVIGPYSKMLQLVDVACGPLDEWCTARLIRNWRDDVWQQAMTLIRLSDNEERKIMRQRVDQRALDRAHLLSGNVRAMRSFGYPLRWLKRLRLL
jgi:hypothetical protein